MTLEQLMAFIVNPYPSPLSANEAAEHAKLLVEYRALEEEYSGQDEYP